MHLSRGKVSVPHGDLGVDALLGLESGGTDPRDVYRAGELKREFGVTHRMLRVYEENGFLRPARQGMRRLYSRIDRKRLRLAILSQAFGFTLGEAAQIIDLYGGLRNISTTVGVSD